MLTFLKQRCTYFRDRRLELICLLISCSEIFLKTSTKISMVEFFVKLQTISFTKNGLRHGCFFSGNFPDLSKNAIFHSTSWLLLISRSLIRLIWKNEMSSNQYNIDVSSKWKYTFNNTWNVLQIKLDNNW